MEREEDLLEGFLVPTPVVDLTERHLHSRLRELCEKVPGLTYGLSSGPAFGVAWCRLQGTYEVVLGRPSPTLASITTHSP